MLGRDTGPVDPQTGLTAGETAELVELLNAVAQIEEDSVIDHEPDPVRAESVRVEQPVVEAPKKAPARKAAPRKAAKRVPAVPAEAAKAVRAAGARKPGKPAED